MPLAARMTLNPAGADQAHTRPARKKAVAECGGVAGYGLRGSSSTAMAQWRVHSYSYILHGVPEQKCSMFEQPSPCLHTGETYMYIYIYI